MGPRSASGDEASFLRVELQTQCAGEQRLNANAHLAILLSKKHRPVDLWTTRIAKLPTSPTGLHYDGFSLSNSTRNDEEPLCRAFRGSRQARRWLRAASHDAAMQSGEKWQGTMRHRGRGRAQCALRPALLRRGTYAACSKRAKRCCSQPSSPKDSASARMRWAALCFF